MISISFPILLATFIQAIIKLLVWTFSVYLILKKWPDLVEYSMAQMFTTKINWLKLFVISLIIILYLLLGSFIQYGNLAIRDSFQSIDIINTVLMVGITEEAVFRGLLLNSLLKITNTKIAVLISSLLFVAIHFPIWIYSGKIAAIFLSGGFVQVFLLGVLFGVSFIKSKNIFAPIILHMIWNLFTILFYT